MVPETNGRAGRAGAKPQAYACQCGVPYPQSVFDFSGNRVFVAG
jgi:hypothetical protein